ALNRRPCPSNHRGRSDDEHHVRDPIFQRHQEVHHHGSYGRGKRRADGSDNKRSSTGVLRVSWPEERIWRSVACSSSGASTLTIQRNLMPTVLVRIVGQVPPCQRFGQ